MNKFNTIVLFALCFILSGYAMEEEQERKLAEAQAARARRIQWLQEQEPEVRERILTFEAEVAAKIEQKKQEQEAQRQRALEATKYISEFRREKEEREKMEKELAQDTMPHIDIANYLRIQDYYSKGPDEMSSEELRSNFAQAPLWMKKHLWQYIKGSGLVDEVIPEAKGTRVEWRD